MALPVAEQRKQNIMKAVRDYGSRLLYFIRSRVKSREDAEDILQDVWYQFSNVINSEPIEQTSAWLYRVAKNRIIDQYRRRHAGPIATGMDNEFNSEEADSDFHFKEILTAADTTPETEYLRNLFWEELFSALSELPDKQREVFILNELEDIPFNEIAEHTGEKINTLISRKRYAILYLRKRLKQLYIEITEQ